MNHAHQHHSIKPSQIFSHKSIPITYWYAVLFDRMRFIMFSVGWNSCKTLETHIHIETLETPVSKANDWHVFTSVALYRMPH